MLPRTIVCPDCGEAVPTGRSSCPACSAPLLAVAGAVLRPAERVADPAPGNASSDDPSAMTPARIQTQTLPEPSSGDAQDPGPTTSEDPGPATPLPASSIRQTGFPASTSAAIEPGGYFPPGTPVPAASLPDPTPVAPASPVASPLAVAPVAADPGVLSSAAVGAPIALDPARLDLSLGYATAAGAGLVAFGMLMPWSRIVIGAGDASGYFSTWGLAGPGHVVVLLSALAVLAVSALPNRLPVSIRSGVAGLMLGVFSLGLVWPYLIGPLGAGIGVLVVTVGALVLTAAGMVSAWRHRHAADDRSV